MNKNNKYLETASKFGFSRGRAAHKIFSVAAAVRWNRPSEGAALKLKLNDSGIRSYADQNIGYRRRHNICIFNNPLVPFYFYCSAVGLDVVGGCA